MTPDTESSKDLTTAEQSHTSVKQNLDTTPDTELDVLVDDVIHDLEALDFNSVDARNVVQKALTSRDTYWKERVRKEVEGMKGEVREHYDDCDVKTGESHKGECRCGLWRNHHRSRNQALDTLLDNLK